MLTALIFITIFFALAWWPASWAKVTKLGYAWAISNRDQTVAVEPPLWGQRADRAYQNLKDNYPAFAVGVLVAVYLGIESATLIYLAWTFVGCRVVHFVSYLAGVAWLRAFSWLVGLVASLGILSACLVALVD